VSAIDYGDRARLGVILPSGNTVAEPEIAAMLPPGIGAAVTRLPLRGSSEAELLAMVAALEPAAQLLLDARVDVLAFHCTAVSTFAPQMAAEIGRRIGAVTGAGGPRAFATADAILAALAALGARRVALVTPYIDPVHQREIAWLEAHGIAVAGGDRMGIDTNAEMARIPQAEIAARTRRAVAACRGAEACFISCTAIRSAGIVAALEAELGLPVLTSNQALVWHALRMLEVPDRVEGFGRLLAMAGPA
jgi:maleate cis-trans isomerase